MVRVTGGIAELNGVLATLVYRGGLNFGGDDTLNITASDGDLSASGGVAIHVKSAAEQAADLQAQVTALQSAGVLNQGQANALSTKMNLKGTTATSGRCRRS